MSHWIYGRQSVLEVLNSGAKVIRVLLSQGTDDLVYQKIKDDVQRRNIPFETLSRRALDAVIRGNHQGVAAEVSVNEPQDLKKFLASLDRGKKSFVCLLDEVQDPQNLGAVMRSAVCFGCAGMIIPGRRSAKLTGAVMKSSSGAFAHLPLVEVSNIGVAIERLKENGFWVVGADAESGEPLEKFKFDFPLALVLGSEHRGIKPLVKKNCDRLLTIPQQKKIASLNVSAAAAVILYEIYKQIGSCGSI